VVQAAVRLQLYLVAVVAVAVVAADVAAAAAAVVVAVAVVVVVVAVAVAVAVVVAAAVSVQVVVAVVAALVVGCSCAVVTSKTCPLDRDGAVVAAAAEVAVVELLRRFGPQAVLRPFRRAITTAWRPAEARARATTVRGVRRCCRRRRRCRCP
jgi:hypothetical protein